MSFNQTLPNNYTPVTGTIGPLDTSNIAIAKLDGTLSNKVTQFALQSFQVNAARITDNNYIGSKLCFATIGDSVALDAWFPMYRGLIQGYGFGAVHGGGTQAGTIITLGGGSTGVGTPVLITSLTRVGSTVTATSANHGLSNATVVGISGASNAFYNISTPIANVTANTFEYTITGTPVTPDPSSTIYWTAAADYTKWVTGGWVNLPVGGTVSYYRPNFASLPNAAFNTGKVFFVKEVGAGTFKIQTSADGITWADLAGYASISAVDTQDNFGVVTAPLGAVSGQYQIRAVGVTGTVKIIALGLEADKGAKLSFLFGAGGLKIKDMALTPQRIWVDALREASPDTIFLMFKDDVDADMITALSTIQANIDAALSTCRVIWSATVLGPGEEGFVGVPVNTWATTQNAEVEKFVNLYTGQSVISYWDCTKYVGKWSKAAALGAFDSTTPANISTSTISGTTVTISTAIAHGLAINQPVRISRILDNKYNGVFIVLSVVNATTFTYTKLTNLPTISSTGGEFARSDYAHLSDAGRHILCSAFIRDFSMFSGLATKNYPWTIGSEVLDGLGFALKTSINNFTVKQLISDTTEVIGGSYSTGDAAFKIAGGIMSQKTIKSWKQILVESSDPLLGGALYAVQTAVANDGTAGTFLSNYNPIADTGSASRGIYSQVTFNSSGSIGNSSYVNAAVTGIYNIVGSSTGNLQSSIGLYGSVNNNGFQFVSGATAVLGGLGVGPNGRVGSAYCFYAYPAMVQGIVDTSYAFYVDPTAGTNVAGTKWAVYNNSVANSASLGKYKFGAITTPLAFVDITAGTSLVPPIKLTTGVLTSITITGAIEYDGTRFYQTPSSLARQTVAWLSDIGKRKTFRSISTTLTLDNTAIVWIFTGTSNGTWTLPTISSYLDGYYTIKNSSAFNLTIICTGSDKMYNDTEISNIVIPAGFSINLSYDSINIQII